ncbi:MAG: TIGR03960 family B12-binding radical SAM protein [Clostridia bacterium]|nr:TIGR03960 family B12-binding radical SAM protein [Clostridia bacterium]
MNFDLKDKILRSVTKPGRYIGGEYGEILKDKNAVKCRFAFAFPDTYEIGMSNLGVRILYGALNREEDIWCERCYSPWVDMEEQLRSHNLPMWAHESGDPLKDFDFLGFTLQYEMCYTNVVNLLDLAQIPLLSADRREDDPIVIGGGPCTYNPEPVCDFFDLFSIGEGEDALVEVCRLYINMKENGTYTRKSFLHEAAKLPGFYVPSLYTVTYKEDGTIEAYTPVFDDIPKRITKRIMKDLNTSYYPEKVVMPYIETVHDRIMLEVYRGCIRGCRFCQAGMTYRPVREKTPEILNEQAKKLYEATGYDEISLSSLSISDYTCLDTLTDELLEWTDEAKVSLSLPSLRVNSFTPELMEKISGVRASGITFAPEAGTQRLRDVINKNLTEEDLLRACNVAFDYGKNTVKLYFMNGLPTETDDDIRGIAELARCVVSAYYKNPKAMKNRAPTVTVSVSCFIPKPWTPFQWEPQQTMEELRRKQTVLFEAVSKMKHVTYKWHDAKTSHLEGVFARGDRRLSKALLAAHRRGLKFDSWDEFFDYDAWMAVFEECGIDPAFYANRTYSEDEVLAWDIIDPGVTKEFLKRERKKAYAEITTPSCREQCSGCGANKLGGERSCCPKGTS